MTTERSETVKGQHSYGGSKEVEASINERGKAVGGRPGDQTGREFLIRSYRNYPWSNVLRYVWKDSDRKVSENVNGKMSSIFGGSAGKVSGGRADIVLKKGSRGDAVKVMQRMLAACGYGCGSSGADGVFGKETYKALVRFQEEHGLDMNDRHYDRKNQDMQERLNNLYDQITDTEDTLRDVDRKIEASEEERISAEGMYRILKHWNGIYGKMTELERKEFFGRYVRKILIYPDRKASERIIKQIDFKFPVSYNNERGEGETRLNQGNAVETVVYLRAGLDA